MAWKLRSENEEPRDQDLMFANKTSVEIGWWDCDHFTNGDPRSDKDCLDWATHWDYLPECPK